MTAFLDEDGEPLKDGEPIPTGYSWKPTPATTAETRGPADQTKGGL